MRGPGPRARRLLLGVGGVVLVGGIVAGGLVAAGTAGLIPADLGSVLAPPQVSPSPEPTASAPARPILSCRSPDSMLLITDVESHRGRCERAGSPGSRWRPKKLRAKAGIRPGDRAIHG